MGITVFNFIVLLFGMCFSIYNWWFQHEKYKRLMEEEKKKLNPFTSPAAWGIYSIVFLLLILIMSGYYIYRLVEAIIKLNSP